VKNIGGSQLDYGMRIYDPRLGRFLSVDPLFKTYPSVSPYPFAMNRPIDGIDLDGEEWKAVVVDSKTTGYLWDPAHAYSDKAETKLNPGYYNQAIYFSDKGNFSEKTEFNMGTSTATVYKANGKTEDFDATIYPARAGDYATTPEGNYEATVGPHKKSYVALHMHNTGNTGSESIDLGGANPSNPSVTTATGIHIHHAGVNNKTGLTTDGKPISAGCLLIDVNNWDRFIGIFNTTAQKNNTIGVTVSRQADNGQVYNTYQGNSAIGTSSAPGKPGSTMLRDNSSSPPTDNNTPANGN
jgi:hypothetical protein